MKNFAMALLLTSLTVPLALDASAQQTPGERRDTQMQRDTQRQAWQKPADAVESNKLIGAKVKGADGKDVGEIDALIVDTDGKVSHVVVGRGGVAGIGETKVVVPWSDVKMSWDRDRDNPVITMDSTVLERAPRYERGAIRHRERTPAASPATTPKTREK
ncbi:MAG TPA: PRC-barrel domain-containing protein [Methylomirabilota bacterium]|nr:PRC-barrel domain-containing protein [Methylomirabilota bacterium]